MGPVETRLTRALTFIEKGWTNHVVARVLAGGAEVDPWAPDATCWCAAGALMAAHPSAQAIWRVTRRARRKAANDRRKEKSRR